MIRRPTDLPDLTLEVLPGRDFTVFAASCAVHRARWGAQFAAPRQVVDTLNPDALESLVWGSLDPILRPWLRADRRNWPRFEPFPRWAALVRRLRRCHVHETAH